MRLLTAEVGNTFGENIFLDRARARMGLAVFGYIVFRIDGVT